MMMYYFQQEMNQCAILIQSLSVSKHSLSTPHNYKNFAIFMLFINKIELSTLKFLPRTIDKILFKFVRFLKRSWKFLLKAVFRFVCHFFPLI